MAGTRYRVAFKAPVARDIVELRLVPAEGGALPAFGPGAHLRLHLPAIGVRAYSLCNGPGERDWLRLAVKREPDGRGGSAYIHRRLAVGDTIEAEGPFNFFALDPGDHQPVLVAGGIGITPILAMARQLAATGAEFRLLYLARSPGAAAFHDEILGDPALAGSTELMFSDNEMRSARLLYQALATPREGAAVYTCGPEPVMTLVERAVAHWPGVVVHRESFNPAAAADGAAFEVEIRSSGRVIEVGPGQSIVEALRDQGIVVEVSCGQGVCGSCITGVVAGDVDHRDHVLFEHERAAGDRIACCVSRGRAGGRIVLDL